MRWFEKLAKFIEKRGGKRQLFRAGKDGKPALYMDRYYILKTPFLEIMIHNFHMGDRPDFHDHPWASGGMILAEGYIEHTPKGDFYREPGDMACRGANGLHWVELHPGTEGKVWTLFVTGPRVREWGYNVKGEWMSFREYFRRDGTLTVQSLPAAYKGWFFPRKVD